MKPLLLLTLAAAAFAATVEVNGKQYEVSAEVKVAPCDDLHPNACRPRAKGVPKLEVAQVTVKLDGRVVGQPFEVECKSEGCREDSREEWVKVALRRFKR